MELNSYGVYLRFELMRGELSAAEYEASITQLKTYLAKETSRLHWQEFLGAMSV